MTRRSGQRWRRYALAGGLCVLLLGALVVRRALYGQGRLHAMARALYHRYQTARRHDTSADQIAPEPADGAPVTVAVTIDAGAGRHPISPYIYGMAFAPPDYLRDLRLGSNRWGGNDKSRYNWVQGNASNAARDWRWANRAAADGNFPPRPSSAADHFIAQNRTSGAATLLTIPTIGWVARDADNVHASQNVPKEGGTPLAAVEGAIAGYDPAENWRRTSVRSLARKGQPFFDSPTLTDGVVYQDEWVHHLVRRFGTTAAGGVRFYAMDNEPDLWDSTHTDVHPARMGYDDLLANFLDYATAVKAVDPTAQVNGPVCSGWTGYLYSALDRGDDNFRTHADCTRHGGDAFLLWFLKQVRAHDLRSSQRTLDVLDVHFYPQGAELFGAGAALDAGAQARRLRATRALWDPQYTDESWIGEPIRLIPRLKEWIAAGYPGTQIGITEWNFGADEDINGALAISDALGIYGREGVYLANYWTYPAKGSPGYLAFRLYRNADGQGNGFGDVSCQAISADPNWVSCYAAIDAKRGDLTVVLVNRLRRNRVMAPIILHGLQITGSTARLWSLSAHNPKAILSQAGPSLHNGCLTLMLPPYSITFVRFTARKGS